MHIIIYIHMYILPWVSQILQVFQSWQASSNQNLEDDDDDAYDEDQGEEEESEEEEDVEQDVPIPGEIIGQDIPTPNASEDGCPVTATLPLKPSQPSDSPLLAPTEPPSKDVLIEAPGGAAACKGAGLMFQKLKSEYVWTKREGFYDVWGAYQCTWTKSCITW